MTEEGEVVFIKVFDKWMGDVVFEGKVSTDVTPEDLVQLGCFLERYLDGLYIKETEEPVKSFKGLQDHVELVARSMGYNVDILGVLYVGAEDKVLRKGWSVPSRECVMMSVSDSSHEECEKAFKCETLEVLEINWCKLLYVPTYIGKMKKLKKLALYGLSELTFLPEEMGDLSSLEELQIGGCAIEGLPRRLKDLKMLKSLRLTDMDSLRLCAWDAEDVFSKLNHLTIMGCNKTVAAHFSQPFWRMIKSTTHLRVLDLNWEWQPHDETVAALTVNGSIIDGKRCFFEEEYFKRNRDNHQRTHLCVVLLLAMRRWRNALNNVPKEMVRMIAMALLNTRCDAEAWSKK